jgi:hypothetical protein
MESFNKNLELLKTIASTVSIASGFVSLAGLAILWNTYEQLQWKPVNATISRSQLVLKRGSTTQKTPRWALEIEYRFHVRGKEFVSHSFSSTPPTSGGKEPSKEMLSLAEKYKVGEIIQVYASEANPNRSVVIRPEQPQFLVLLIGFVFFVPGFILYLKIR